MTLHLTPAEAEQLAAAGSGVLFREGVRQDPTHQDITHWSIGADDISPPAEFVEAAAACETCGPYGGGTVEIHTGEYIKGAPVYRFADCPNPDCLDGKRRVAAVVPCGCSCHKLAPAQGVHCQCMDLTVGPVVVTWGPLVVVGYRRTLNKADEVQLTDGTWIAPPLGVNPASLIGQYSIGVEVAS